MWTRRELKTSAKGVLSKNYWYGILAFLIYGAIVGIPSGIISGIRNSVTTNHINDLVSSGNIAYADIIKASFLSAFNPVFLILTIALGVFLISPLIVGLYKYYLNLREDNKNLSELFFSFKDGNYLNVVGSMAWAALFRVLWTFLFIVPGIIKSIAYSMTPFILADNPRIGYKRALKLSMAMTKGHKGAIFVLYLSFIGWGLLGIIACCGIGDFFLAPYITATYAELYVKLRNNAIESGICTAEELNLKRI